MGRNAVILSKAYRSASQRTFAEAEVAGLRPLALRDQRNVLWDHVVSLADGRGNERQWCRRSSFGLGSHLASDANSQVQRIMFAVSGLHISIEIVSSGGKDNSSIVNAQEDKKCRSTQFNSPLSLQKHISVREKQHKGRIIKLVMQINKDRLKKERTRKINFN